MTKPIDLDALDKARAACTGKVLGWSAPSIAKILDAYPAMSAELRERRAREEAMAAELRALREVAEAARAFVPTCAETVIVESIDPTDDDPANTRECGKVATHVDRMGGHDMHLLCAEHAEAAFKDARKAESKGCRGAVELGAPRPLDPDPRVDALRAALAKVPQRKVGSNV
jgi:hypothetical protein